MLVFVLLFLYSFVMGIIVFLFFYLYGGVFYFFDLYLIKKLWGF